MTPSMWAKPRRRHARATDGDVLALLQGRGDGQIEALAFECLADGVADERVMSLLRVLGWHDGFDCFAIAGTPENGFAATRDGIRAAVSDLGGDACLVGLRGSACVALIALRDAVTPEVTCTAVSPLFADDAPLCIGPVRQDVEGASRTVVAVLSALAAVPAVASLPRPMRADDVLPERALLGDQDARDELYASVYLSLRGENADDPTLDTVTAFLRSGGSLETTAKELNVHPNTVRYRLKRAAETTGWDATDSREAYVLQTAIAVGLMRDAFAAGRKR